jgi:O-acetyl-ADP-ribose deacetylase (regulator of RNase III)
VNTQLAEHLLPGGARLVIRRGDITEEHVDAIVNPANTHLAHGGGVAGAIVVKGGPEIQRESNAIGRVAVGSAVITTAGKLPCRAVIHAVGPRWGEGDEESKLRSAARSSLALAQDRGFETIALPAISSGIFGFPKDRCAEILLEAAEEFLREHPAGSLREVAFCLYDMPTVQAFENAWRRRVELATRTGAD